MLNLITQIENLVTNEKTSFPCVFAMLADKSSPKSEMHTLKITAKNELFQVAGSGVEPKIMKTQIQALQRRTIRILNYFFTTKTSCRHTICSSNQLHSMYINTFVDLLSFLEHQFPKYFDKDAMAPIIYIEEKRQSISSQINLVMEQSKSIPGLGQAIFHLLKKNKNQYSFTQLEYLVQLVRKMAKAILTYNDNSELTYGLITLFITNNFNSISAYNYVISYIEKRTKGDNNEHLDLYKLSLIEKNISQIMENKQYRYTNKHGSLKKNILKWLDKEIIYSKYDNQPQLEHPFEPDELPKLKFSLSVPQIGFLFRHFVDCGIIITSKKEDTFKKIAQTCSSKNAANIFAGSLHSQYYKPTLTTKSEIKVLMLDLFKSIKDV